MNLFLKTTVVSLSLMLLLVAAGCTNESASPTPAVNTNANASTAASPSASASPATSARAETAGTAAPLTLPVLDAFFADESFPAELKTKLQLTDEQVTQLRTVAREETAKLRETDANGQYSGSTAAARQLAAERIKAIIGEEKSQQLALFVRERWSGGESAAGSGKDNQGTSAKSAQRVNAVPQDTRIVVNTPAYRMDVFEGGKLIKSYKVGIGYPEFPLPTGERKASQIIFNPTWTPPDSPWVETSNHVKPGEKIEAGNKLNPLGPIKIPIGLPSLIHGGKSPARLGGFASHGCVGLTDKQVQEFSLLLARIGGAQLTAEEVAGYDKERKTNKEVKPTNVNLKNPVPVELRYETIVVEDGKLHIYRDVYDRDTNTEENLRAVLSAYGVSLDQLSEEERAQALNALKEMSRDATGKLDQPGEPAKKDEQKNAKKAEKTDGAKVTRTVKGQKEIVLEIAALQGKGYPAPVDFNTGGAPNKTATPATGKSSGRKR
ncbi:MAG TPA: L,D-transpeptidase [Pyrinomonadaceae bacterium]